MRKNSFKALFLIVIFTLLLLNVFSQTTPQLHVMVSGHGKTQAIFIPGFSCSGQVWDETVNKFSKDLTCHVITFPGFAGEPAQGEANLRDWENGITAYIEKNKLGQVVLIGHSIGGGIAMSFAADHPELISKIVVVDAVPYLNALFNPAAKANPNADCSPMVKQFTGMSTEQLYQMQKQIIPSMIADTSKIATAIKWSMDSDRGTMGRIYCQFTNTDLREKIGKIKCPSLILLEAPFQKQDTQLQQQYAALVTKSIHYSTKGLHFIMYDDKDWFFQQLVTFLQ